jgi:hypothetical protein
VLHSSQVRLASGPVRYTAGHKGLIVVVVNVDVDVVDVVVVDVVVVDEVVVDVVVVVVDIVVVKGRHSNPAYS